MITKQYREQVSSIEEGLERFDDIADFEDDLFIQSLTLTANHGNTQFTLIVYLTDVDPTMPIIGEVLTIG